MTDDLIVSLSALKNQLLERCNEWILAADLAYEELTLKIKAEHIREMCFLLRDDAEFAFNMLIDVCGVDYLHYGVSEWEGESATSTGFSRGYIDHLSTLKTTPHAERFAVTYHLLSFSQNQRLRLKVMLPADEASVDSVNDIWPAASWFEREAFDLFGIVFRGHPDLRRILTDYGFLGYPFRKDFPISGHVEVRYDADEKRVLYEPVQIEPRILEPKVIRTDNRYKNPEENL